mmetsp:Transcript_39320/g.113072  ORF Transcript_39320/g.113072 Transcript_39320/m.113072 type:complete len:368 (+) Transcript_39320:139-1242(+)
MIDRKSAKSIPTVSSSVISAISLYNSARCEALPRMPVAPIMAQNAAPLILRTTKLDRKKFCVVAKPGEAADEGDSSSSSDAGAVNIMGTRFPDMRLVASLRGGRTGVGASKMSACSSNTSRKPPISEAVKGMVRIASNSRSTCSRSPISAAMRNTCRNGARLMYAQSASPSSSAPQPAASASMRAHVWLESTASRSSGRCMGAPRWFSNQGNCSCMCTPRPSSAAHSSKVWLIMETCAGANPATFRQARAESSRHSSMQRTNSSKESLRQKRPHRRPKFVASKPRRPSSCNRHIFASIDTVASLNQSCLSNASRNLPMCSSRTRRMSRRKISRLKEPVPIMSSFRMMSAMSSRFGWKPSQRTNRKKL